MQEVYVGFKIFLAKLYNALYTMDEDESPMSALKRRKRAVASSNQRGSRSHPTQKGVYLFLKRISTFILSLTIGRGACGVCSEGAIL